MTRSKLLVLGAAVAVFCLGVQHQPALAFEDEPTAPALLAIDQALDSGSITEAEAILYKLYFVKASDRLPKAFDLGGDRIRCGTAIVQEAREKMEQFPTEIRLEIENFLARPSLPSFIDTAHFRIHYATSGTNIIYGWPNTAYRDAVMDACETSWQFMHVEKGWQVPPSDGTSGGGVGLIDCYVTQLSGVYGYTESEAPGPNYPSDYTAFFVIDNDYTGFGYSDRTLPMKVTVAHEYHHVVQMGYTVGNNWWMENMATFMEDEVYDSINDNYNYLNCYMFSPWKKATTFNGCFEYACFLWPTYLSERFDHSVVREVQECAATTNVFTCFDTVLGGEGTNYSGGLAEWQLWNFYTRSDRDDGNHYVEGGDYPYTLFQDKTYTTYPQMNQHPTNTRLPEATGASIQRFVRDGSSPHNKLIVTFDGPNCTRQVVLVAKQAGAQVFHEAYMNLDSNGNGAVEVLNWDNMEYAHMIVSMARECGNGTFDYLYSAETTQSVDVGEHAPLYTRTVVLEQNYPNPFGPETAIGYALRQGGGVQLAVFDAAGRQVRGLIETEQAPGEYSVRWDGRNDAGHRVAPGVYFYRLNVAGETEVRKLVVAQ